MLAKNLLQDIGFTAEQQEKYFYYKNLAGDKLEKPADDYMTGKTDFATALKTAQSFENKDLHIYTLNILFVLECTSYLLDKYIEKGIDKEIFITSMKDLKYKLNECLAVTGIYGTNVVEWYERFLDLRRVALGRLQFNVAEFEEEQATIDGYTVKRGDFVIACHIPSAGPLKPELCEDSFKRAYEFFKDKVNDGVLPVTCDSWLLYPPYKDVFGENSNTGKFIKYFTVIENHKTEKFEDAWRVFNMDFDGDVNKLPNDTSMRRAFIEYINQGGGFGCGYGLALLDGKKF